MWGTQDPAVATSFDQLGPGFVEVRAVKPFGTRHANESWDEAAVTLKDPKRGINK